LFYLPYPEGLDYRYSPGFFALKAGITGIIFYISVCKLSDIAVLNGCTDCIEYNRPNIIDVCNGFMGPRYCYFRELSMAAAYKNCAFLQYFVTTGIDVDINNILDALDDTILAKKIQRYYSR